MATFSDAIPHGARAASCESTANSNLSALHDGVPPLTSDQPCGAPQVEEGLCANEGKLLAVLDRVASCNDQPRTIGGTSTGEDPVPGATVFLQRLANCSMTPATFPR